MSWKKEWIEPVDIKTIKGELPEKEKYNINTYKTYHGIYLGCDPLKDSFAHHYQVACHKDTYEFWHFCPRCDLWIEGEPEKEREETMQCLSGRSGTVKRCRKCGVELDFFGAIS